MPSPFLSSEEYDERAHQLYNEGNYDDALDAPRRARHLSERGRAARRRRLCAARPRRVRVGAAHLRGSARPRPRARGRTRRARRDAAPLRADAAAMKAFRRILELGYEDDIELMLQVGRALFRDGLIEDAKEFFEVAVQQAPDNAEAVAMVGYAQHRLGDDDAAMETLRKRARSSTPSIAEARIYLGNILYDRGEYEAALYHLDRTKPEDHWDELGIWRLMELKKSHLRLPDDDP